MRAHRWSMHCVCYRLADWATTFCSTFIVARLTYAASTWYDLTKASDRKCIDSVLDRAQRHGYCLLDLPVFDDLCKIADDELFGRAMRLSNHVLHALIPPQSSASQRYNLQHRPHLLQLPPHTTHLSD